MEEGEIEAIRQELTAIKVAMAEMSCGGSFIGEPALAMAPAVETTGGSSYVDNGCFKIAGTSGLELTLRNCLFMVGGKLHDELGSGANYEATFTLDASMPVLAVEIDTESSSSSTLVDFASIASLKTACEGELLKYYLPLYEFAIDYDATSQTYSVSVKRDLRNIPTAAMMEV